MPVFVQRCVRWCLLACLVTSVSAEDSAVAPQLREVGVAKEDITPDYPIRLSGFGFRRTESEGVTAPIFARALAIGSDAEGPALLLTVDSTGVSQKLVEALAERVAPLGIRPDRLAVTATHSHTAPMISGVLPTLFGEPVPQPHQTHIDQYTKELLDHLEAVCRAALQDRQPAYLSWGQGEVGFAKNRRQADGPIDHRLPLLAVKSPAGKLRAVLTTYACHAVTLSHNFVGGDWPGFAAESIERQNPQAVAMISIGCGADQNPNSDVTGDKVDVARAQGMELAAEVQRLLGGYLAPVRGPLTTKTESIDLPLAKVPDRAHWESLVSKGGYIGYHALVQLAALDRGESLPTSINYAVQTWGFGDDLAMVFLPGEVVADYAHDLRRTLDSDRLWIHAYANNTPCYIPSERVLKVAGYEGAGAMTYYNWPAPFAPGLEQKIVDLAVSLTPQTFHRPQPLKADAAANLTPQQSMKRMELRDGVRIQLVAAEPLLADPVAIDFGADGRLWVCEMHDYPLGLQGNYEAGGRVRLLHDDNGDGIYDRSTIFLDGLPFPTGVTAWKKGVLVCAAPDILYAEDTNGDGVADHKEVLFTGFGTENYQARVNSLTPGLDGWIYGACGLFGGQIHSTKRNETLALGHRDFRMNPETGVMEPLSGRTQQGFARTDGDDWFGCNNSQPLFHYPILNTASRPGLPVPATTVYVPRGKDVLQLFPLLAEYQRFKLSGPAGRVTAACGLGIYRDDLLGAEYAGNAFVCEPVNLVVHRRTLAEDGMTFTAHRGAGEEQTEFLRSTDNQFRPVQARTGPDGGLWIVDMARAVIEHPRWIPEEMKVGLDVREGERRGRLYRILPSQGAARPIPNLAVMSPTDLVNSLQSPNGIVRDLAQQQLFEQQPADAVPALHQLVANPQGQPAGRAAALWCLSRQQAVTVDDLQAALSDQSPLLRRQGVLVLAQQTPPVPQAAALLEQLQAETSPKVLAAVLDALPQLPQEQRMARLATFYLANSQNPYLAFLCLRSVPEAEWPRFVQTVAASPSLTAPQLSALFQISLSEQQTAAVGSLLDQILAQPLDAPQFPWGLLEQFLTSPLATKMDLPPAKLAEFSQRVSWARQQFATADTPEAVRLQVCGLLTTNDDDLEGDRELLLNRLGPQSSPALQKRILAVLDRRFSDDVAQKILSNWNGYGPVVRADLLDRLLSRPAGTKLLLAELSAGSISPAQLDAARRQQLLEHADAEIRSMAQQVWSVTAPASRAAIIKDYQAIYGMTGNIENGRAVYVKRCANCHALEGLGHAVGPNLGEARNKPWSALLVALLDPNQAVDQRYVTYTAVGADGRTHQGILSAETDEAITLKAAEAKTTTIARADLDELIGSNRSLMPEGLERDLTPQDVVDVLALLTQRTQATPEDGQPIEEIARKILDDAAPAEERNQAIADSAARSAELVAALTANLPPGNEAEEYRRIPWIWRVTIAAGKRNQLEELRSLLNASLPEVGAPLLDWQAVVIGGGLINGITQAGAWPHERIAEAIGNNTNLQTRWKSALAASVVMTDNPKVRTGTRYDALRMIALQGWAAAGEQLTRYLAANAHPELQMGAVSGTADVPDPAATTALLNAYPGLTARNRTLALEGLLRSEARRVALLEAIHAGQLERTILSGEQIQGLLADSSQRVRELTAALPRIGKKE